ncbi:UbiA family prenyltransferase [Streptomyces sp. NPDC056503]|uniref:UbiA family prenyltransferase n=1 Tax=Streptomyces sp. NPDC056503 TaxID=3345842 RepID=UPI00367AB8F0
MTTQTGPLGKPLAPTPVPGPLTFLSWTNVTLGAGAAAFTWVTALVLHRPGDPLIAAFAFLFIAAGYTRDRLQSADADADTSPRAAWVARHRRPLTGWAVVCAAALVPVTVLRPWCAAILATVGVMAWFYATPLVPWRGRRLAPRQLPCVKLPYTMAAWVLITVLLPAVHQHRLHDPRLWWLALAGALVGSVGALLNDLRDVDNDLRDGTMSVPVLLGERRTRAAAYGMAACGAVAGQLVEPVPFLLWALYAAAMLASYRPRPGVHPRPWGDAQGLVLLAAVMLVP